MGADIQLFLRMVLHFLILLFYSPPILLHTFGSKAEEVKIMKLAI